MLLGMPVEALLPAWRGNKVDVGVLTPEERSDHAFRGTALKLWIQKGDCERVAKGRCEREGIHSGTVYGVMMLTLPRASQGEYQRLFHMETWLTSSPSVTVQIGTSSSESNAEPTTSISPSTE